MQCVSQFNTQGYLVQALRFSPLGYSASINLLRLSELHLIAAFPPLRGLSCATVPTVHLGKELGTLESTPYFLLPPPTSRDS